MKCKVLSEGMRFVLGLNLSTSVRYLILSKVGALPPQHFHSTDISDDHVYLIATSFGSEISHRDREMKFIHQLDKKQNDEVDIHPSSATARWWEKLERKNTI